MHVWIVCCVYRLYGVESEFLSPTAIKARLPILRTEDLLVSRLKGGTIFEHW